jgi:hypothetical protein
MTLDTQTCVVTGASRGIGRGVADGVQEQFFEHSRLGRFADIEGSIGSVRPVARPASASMTGRILTSNGGMER